MAVAAETPAVNKSNINLYILVISTQSSQDNITCIVCNNVHVKYSGDLINYSNNNSNTTTTE